MDITQWLKDEILEDHTEKPILINSLIRDLSDKYDVQIDVSIIAIKKHK